MEKKEKSNIIRCIMAILRMIAYTEKKQFNEGDIFFALVFKNDQELRNIAKLCGV